MLRKVSKVDLSEIIKAFGVQGCQHIKFINLRLSFCLPALFYLCFSTERPMEGGILNDDFFMRAALNEAKRAFEEDEVPVGAVVVCKSRIIARAYNMTEKLHDVTAHAEMLALTAASNFLNSKFLDECTLYVTLEPCIMCAGAALWTRPERVVYGADDPKKGYSGMGTGVLHPKTLVTRGVLGAECAELLKEFFKKKRD